MSPLEQLASLAALWGSDVRVSVRRGTWYVRVVNGGGRDVTSGEGATLDAAIETALIDLRILDAQETGS